MPVLDGFHWSKPDDLAGIRGVSDHAGVSQPLLTKGIPEVREAGSDSLVVTCVLASGGTLRIRCDPDRLIVNLNGASVPEKWCMELGWAEGKDIPITEVTEHAIGCRHEGFGYSLRCGGSKVSRVQGKNKILMEDHDGSVILNFCPDSSTTFHDEDDSASKALGDIHSKPTITTNP